MYLYVYMYIYIYISPPPMTALDPLKLIILIILGPFGCNGPSETCSISSCQILTLRNALQLEKGSLLGSIFLFRPYGHLQG